MTRCRTFIAALALSLCGAAAVAADQATPPDLPSTELARQAIDGDPSVVEARRAQSAATHGAAALRASPHEWMTKLTTQRRRVESVGNSNEWTATLERTIRIGGKAEIDRRLGEAELAIAQARIGEARHEAARALADLWLDALATSRLRALWAEQLGFAETSHKAVDTRRRAGDASVLDLTVARADLIEVQRQLSAASTAEARAKAKLATRFPTLRFDARPLADPVPLEMTQAQWRERILSESDALKIAEGQLKKAELAAARARAERMPDPTVGVYTANEAFRNERIVGLSISIPLSGTYREQRMHQALQEAQAARARVDRQRLEEEMEIAEAFVEASGGLERWQLASQGLAAVRDSARLMQRAYTLGEADLQRLLLARKQALDAASAAEQARVDALRWHYRLLIDAHLIWGLADE